MLLSHRFYQNPTFLTSTGIGFTVGIMALTRPTELIAAIIPILWAVNSYQGVKNRFVYIFQHYFKYLNAVFFVALMGLPTNGTKAAFLMEAKQLKSIFWQLWDELIHLWSIKKCWISTSTIMAKIQT
jgi:hypothetical protein